MYIKGLNKQCDHAYIQFLFAFMLQVVPEYLCQNQEVTNKFAKDMIDGVSSGKYVLGDLIEPKKILKNPH